MNKNATNKQIQEAFKKIQEDRESSYKELYTDESKSPEGNYVGAGVFWPHHVRTIKHKLPQETSIFSAEAWALLQAINSSGRLQLDNYNDLYRLLKRAKSYKRRLSEIE